MSTLTLISGSGLTCRAPHPVVGLPHSRNNGSGTPTTTDTNARIFAVLSQPGASLHWRFPGSPHRTHHRQYPSARVRSVALPNRDDTQLSVGSGLARGGR